MAMTIQDNTPATNGAPKTLAMDPEGIRTSFRQHLKYTLARGQHDHAGADNSYLFQALALTLRDRLIERLTETAQARAATDVRQVAYISMEFLMGRTLNNALLNLGIEQQVRDALAAEGIKFDDVINEEQDAGLGNGGLGRLAACFLDSCATLRLPVTGYGIRYRYGMFRQRIDNGHQVEEPDHWLVTGHPWEIRRQERSQRIQFGGRTERYHDFAGRLRYRWVDSEDVIAIPYDVPVPGYQNDFVNTLRLWRSAATDEFDLSEFNAGDYTDALASKNQAANITMVLYPNDSSENGKELRLRQQYFLASASLQDALAHYREQHGDDFSQFSSKLCFQLNDTHPAIAIPELMRLLVDVHGHDWDAAWEITTQTIAYTNHTLLPEALEKWSVPLFERLLPRLLDIIYQINAQFLAQVACRWPGDVERQRRLSIFEEGHTQMVRMAHLAVCSSFSVNGVAALHTDLLKQGLFRDFYELSPEKFNNKTNGVTQRRWLAACNPSLAALISEKIGSGWITDLNQISEIAQFADDPDFRERWRLVRHHNKQRLAELVARETNIRPDVNAIFDVQVKRIHEYKRQLLNVLHAIHRYCLIKNGKAGDMRPRCILIGGKAAPGYSVAKRIIKLANNVAEIVNSDPDTDDLLQLVFLPDYRVSTMEVICPATDLSEQISTAGKEASGTGNMKFMMNGALTVGTLDGANIEIRDAVGAENFYLFGLTTEELPMVRANYNPRELMHANRDILNVIELITHNHFSRNEHGIFDELVNAMMDPSDQWMTVADFRSYIEVQQKIDNDWSDVEDWTRKSILNSAASGRFSTDRTMREYNRDIWKTQTVTESVGPTVTV